MSASPEELSRLRELSRRMRIQILEMLAEARSGHPGGSLSAIDIVVSLYFHKLRYRVDDPVFHNRDHFILSKGHACPAQYVCLAEAGYFNKEHLLTLRKIDSMLQGHPDMAYTPGVEMSTGSLGQGLSVASGVALGLKRDGNDKRVYVLMGDGESEEGMVWEAAMSAPRFQLDNLTAILDHNGLATDGWVEDLVGLEPIVDRYRAFGWAVFDVDGHDHAQIIEALDEADKVKGQPSFIRARTVKGKGVSFMENNHKFHGVAPSPEQLEQALQELGAAS